MLRGSLVRVVTPVRRSVLGYGQVVNHVFDEWRLIRYICSIGSNATYTSEQIEHMSCLEHLDRLPPIRSPKVHER